MKEKSAIGVIFSSLRGGYRDAVPDLLYGPADFLSADQLAPLLIRETGASMSQASIITALFPLGGGIGVLILGALMDKINPNKVVAVGWLLTGVFVCRWVLHQQLGANGSDGLYRRQHYERRAVVDAGAGGWLLSDAGRHRRRPDAGYRPLRRHPRRVQRRLPDAGSALLETIFTLLAIPAFLSAFALLIKYRVSKSVPATTDEARSLQKA